MASNFAFLKHRDEALFRICQQAERYYATDPVTSLIKLRQFGEGLARLLGARAGFAVTSADNQNQVLADLAARGLNPQVVDLFHGIRKAGNAATHQMKGDHDVALYHLRMARKLAEWYMRLTGDKAFAAPPFVPPPDPQKASAAARAELQRLRDELNAALQETDQHKTLAEQEAALRALAEQQAAQRESDAAFLASAAEEREKELTTAMAALLEQVATLQAQLAAAPPEQREEKLELVISSSQTLTLDEADTRRLIDEQLRAAGWEADTVALRHAAGARPQKGRNLAIAEWPTEKGAADYVLFVGLTPVGLVEAKRKNKNVPGAIEQAKRYSRAYAIVDDQTDAGGPWEKFRVPFMFSTNGRTYFRQMEEQSGIWFLDGRRPTNHPRPLSGWYTPEGLTQLLALDEAAADASLTATSGRWLELRPYQHDAIEAVEKAVTEGRREMMLAMATGTGKTRTCIGIIYRLLKAKRFRRVLFLVDRTALGEQAHNAFKDVRLEHLQTFNDIYEIKGLGDIRPDSTTRLHLATVQGMMARVLRGDMEVPVDQYDLIVVDECHRGYTLDRDMSESELTFRNEDDYRSKYRRVIDYFDAVKIGLTATPALHTVNIFGPPVYQYSYRQAVIDGYLVDHEPPIRIVTELAEDGMRWEEQSQMKIYSTRAQQLELVTLPDEVTMELESFNRRVLTESFNRTVCEELVKYLDPDAPEKTLVFCATDTHADTVVRLLKQSLDEHYGGVHDDLVMKITGAVDNANEKIRRYKNEQFPQIAVTVDLLTTGIDVPQIANLVFLRRVNSRILYEQMLGRATRLCEDIGKERFRVFDAVDLYAQMQEQSAMKPVVVQPSFNLKKMVAELAVVENEEAKRQILDQILARLQRRKRLVKGERAEAFEAAAGMDPAATLAHLRGLAPDEASSWLAERAALVALIDALTGDGVKYIVSEHEDTLRRVERGYGHGTRPQDYIDEFSRYVREHLNEIPALLAVTQRPRDLTRQALRELKLALEQAGFTEVNLRTAWREMSNQDIAASIIGFIRQGALGSPLVAYDVRVDRALQRILASRTWTPAQTQWLKRIASQMKKETIVDRTALNAGAFVNHGGYSTGNRVFEGRIEQVLGDLQDEVWTDIA